MAVAACLGIAAAGSAFAAAPSAQDTSFLQAAHQSNLAEIAVGELAQSKGTNQQVKELGARFVADHTALDQAVTATASALGVTLPDAPNAEQQAIAAQLEAAAPGREFDTAFVTTQLASHMATMQAGETELAEGSDPAAKKVAADAAPVVASHMDALNDIARALGVPSTVNGGDAGLAVRHADAVPAWSMLGAGMILVGLGAFWVIRRRPGTR